MNWFVSLIKSSIGRKAIMSLTGFSFITFLLVHLGGNLTLYGGPQAFNTYADRLHALGPLVTIAELGLLFFAIIHVVTGITLFYQNMTARPVRYRYRKNAGGRSVGSFSMPYTGLIIFAFVIFHLLNFHFVDKTGTSIYEIVHAAFSSPFYVLLYVFAMLVVSIHVSHGFWSLFQTIGAHHPRYMPLIRGSGWIVSVLFGMGFGFIPVYLLFFV